MTFKIELKPFSPFRIIGDIKSYANVLLTPMLSGKLSPEELSELIIISNKLKDMGERYEPESLRKLKGLA